VSPFSVGAPPSGFACRLHCIAFEKLNRVKVLGNGLSAALNHGCAGSCLAQLIFTPAPAERGDPCGRKSGAVEKIFQ
jgi:hypothetical protein